MNRHSTSAALTLRLRPFGESNREAYFLSPMQGIVQAAVYGGPKSKLRAYVSPFQTGTLYLYHDSVRGTNKVSDFDVHNWRPEIREALHRMLCAAAITDALLAGSGGGSESAAAYALANDSLDALQIADESLCEKVHIHFLWNWLDILGLRPETPHSLNLETPCLRYLLVTQNLKARELERYTLDDAALFNTLKPVLRQYFLAATGRRLQQWPGRERL